MVGKLKVRTDQKHRVLDGICWQQLTFGPTDEGYACSPAACTDRAVMDVLLPQPMLPGMVMSSLTMLSLCAVPVAGGPALRGDRDARPASSCSLAEHLQEMTLQEGTSPHVKAQPAVASAGASSAEAAGRGMPPPAAVAARVKQEPGQEVAGPSSTTSAGGRRRGSRPALTPRVKAESMDSTPAAEASAEEEGFGQVQLQASPEVARLQQLPEEEMPTQGYQSEAPSGEPWADENNAAAGNATHISSQHGKCNEAGRSGAAALRSGRLSASTQVHGHVKTEPAHVTSGLEPS